MGVLKIMDYTGHTEVKYELEDPETVIRAKAEYEKRIKNGATAFVALEDGSFVQVPRDRAFDANQQQYVIVPQVAGG